MCFWNSRASCWMLLDPSGKSFISLMDIKPRYWISVKRQRIAISLKCQPCQQIYEDAEDLALVDKDQVCDCLNKLDAHKSKRLDGMYPWLPREPTNIIVRLPPIIFGRSWEVGKVPEDWRKVSVTPVGKKGTTGRFASPQTWEGDGANLPGNHFQTHESNEE